MSVRFKEGDLPTGGAQHPGGGGQISSWRVWIA